MSDPRRSVPRTDAVLSDARLTGSIGALGRERVKGVVVDVLAQVRSGAVDPGETVPAVIAELARLRGAMRAVINATGVVIHTNLGRSALAPAAVAALHEAAGYTDVEFDLGTGRRGSRSRGIDDALVNELPAGYAAMVVNNGAAALLLAAVHLAAASAGREVIVSRGELIEIGDGFRLPDLIESAGLRLHEVGTTNRTTLNDYRSALGHETACVLKVHPGNFRILGFTRGVDVAELSSLGAPVLVDTGSGLLRPDPQLPDEPDVTSALRAGATLVTCSTDKLLGGPQGGLIAGAAADVAAVRRHPMARAMRADKLSLAALEATLRSGCLADDPVPPRRPRLNCTHECSRSPTGCGADGVDADVLASTGSIGGGSAPGVELSGWAISLPPDYAAALRGGTPPVIGRVEHGRCLLDLRCVDPSADETVGRAVLAVHQEPIRPGSAP